MGNKTNIAFDSQIFRLQVYGGISRYIVELARELALLETLSVNIIAPCHVNEYLKNAPDVPQSSVYLKTMRYGIRTRMDQFACDALIALTRPDIVHATYYLRNKRPINAKHFVVTVHDMTHEKFPQSFPHDDETSSLKRAAVAAADHVICISENTRLDVIKLLGVPRERTTVIHHGVPSRLFGNLPSGLGDKPFFLFVGQRGGYKNFEAVLHAYAASKTLQRNFRLVAFGGKGFTDAEQRLMQRLEINQSAVVHLSGDDSVLSALYTHAIAFIYPSMYEGFGMPLLEAMAHGCPVLSSNASSMPEVAADAALYFDPLNTAEMSNLMEHIVEDKVLRSQLRKAGLERGDKFSWKKAAIETKAVYTELLAK